MVQGVLSFLTALLYHYSHVAETCRGNKELVVSEKPTDSVGIFPLY